MSRRLRRRYTEEEKANYLAKFEAAGTNAAAFCREEGLAYQTFLSWRRSRGNLSQAVAAARPAEFVEVELEPAPACPGRGAGTPAVELTLGAGMVLRIYPTQGGRS